jgi:hypothetical protein
VIGVPEERIGIRCVMPEPAEPSIMLLAESTTAEVGRTTGRGWLAASEP